MILMLGGDLADKMSEVHEVPHFVQERDVAEQSEGQGFGFLVNERL